jgi:hypothetical protein
VQRPELRHFDAGSHQGFRHSFSTIIDFVTASPASYFDPAVIDRRRYFTMGFTKFSAPAVSPAGTHFDIGIRHFAL